MKKRIQFYPINFIYNTPVFLYLTILFLAGAVAGSFTGVIGNTSETVHKLADYMMNIQDYSIANQWIGILFSTMLWLFGCMIAGALPLARMFLSSIVTVRGFTISFTIAAFITQMGKEGIWISFITTGLYTILTIPCLLVTASAAFLAVSEMPLTQFGEYIHALGRYRGALGISILFSVGIAFLRICLLEIIL